MKYLLFAIFFAVMAASAMAKIRFRSCGPSKVTSVVFAGSNNRPTPTVYRGKNYKAIIKFKSGVQASKLKTNWYAIIGGVEMRWEDIVLKDGCKSIEQGCPLVKDKSYVYKEDLPVPETAPPVRTVIKIQQTDQHGNEHMCVLMSLKIK